MKIAEITVNYSSRLKLSECPKISNSNDAYRIFKENWNDDIEFRECFYLMLLNRANRVKGVVMISMGGITGTVADLKIIFAIALKTLSTAIVLAHNHPSGNLKPSGADIKLTRKLKQAGELLEISVLDHLIITTDGYYSFADEGSI